MRTVLVNGANGNLGSAVVRLFAAQGWKVIAFVSPWADSKLYSDWSHVETVKADALSEADTAAALARIMKRYPCIDAAVLTAGGYTSGTLSETTAEQIRGMMELNFFTAWHFAKPLMERMMAQQKGHLVLIGSQAAIHLNEGAYTIGYSVSKTALAKLAALLNETGKSHHVFCSLVSPTVMDTPQNRKAMPDADTSRWQKPEEVAQEIFKVINTKATTP